jgi:glutamyl-tRNA synthetase
VGTAYQALFDLAWARKTVGRFVLRIEDTDQNRLVAGSERQIFTTLKWLGLNYDEGPDVGGPYAPYRQSERLPRYREVAEELLASGKAYYCWCSTERLAELRKEQEASKAAKTGYDRMCLGLTREQRAELPGFSEQPVIRMLVPDDIPLAFQDLVRGEVSTPFPDDQVILKADGFPTYHLAVVVDDHDMGITTVVRGEEWISSTCKHLLLYAWLGWDPPQFAHMPLLRNPDKSKISKRKNPAARLMWFREQGYLPEALLNFLELLAYPPVRESEVQTFEEFTAGFEWGKVNTTGPVFDVKKLDWLNGEYIRALPDEELALRIGEHICRYQGRDFDQFNCPLPDDIWLAMFLGDVVPLIKPRLTRLNEAVGMIDFLARPDDDLPIEDDALATLPENAAEVLDAALVALAPLPLFATADEIQGALRGALVDGMGLKPKVAFGPVRVAITGKRVSPPLFESMAFLNKESSLKRIANLRARLP